MMKLSEKILPIAEDGRENVSLYRLEMEVTGGIAFIEWEPNGELYFIKTPEESRRNGIATILWGQANFFQKEMSNPELKHSAYRTKDGEAWAQSFGVKLPARIPC